MNTTSLHRDPALIPLSHDHHHGLVAAVRLKQGRSAFLDEPDVLESIARLWRDELMEHFRQEEEVLFSREWPANVAELVAQALVDHMQMRSIVAAAQRGEEYEELGRRFGELLETHIRLEERLIFPAMQDLLSDQELLTVGRELAVMRGRRADPDHTS